MQCFGAVYTKDGTIIPSISEADSLYNDGYGHRIRNQLILSSLETLFLLDMNRLIIIDESDRKKVNFKDLFERYYRNDNDLWTKYVVYRDIRMRGFTIKTEDNESGFSVYERGTYQKKPPAYYLYIINEGSSETIGNLRKILHKSAETGRNLKLAVIDRRGEIVYYSLDELDFNNLGF